MRTARQGPPAWASTAAAYTATRATEMLARKTRAPESAEFGLRAQIERDIAAAEAAAAPGGGCFGGAAAEQAAERCSRTAVLDRRAPEARQRCPAQKQRQEDAGGRRRCRVEHRVERLERRLLAASERRPGHSLCCPRTRRAHPREHVQAQVKRPVSDIGSKSRCRNVILFTAASRARECSCRRTGRSRAPCTRATAASPARVVPRSRSAACRCVDTHDGAASHQDARAGRSQRGKNSMRCSSSPRRARNVTRSRPARRGEQRDGRGSLGESGRRVAGPRGAPRRAGVRLKNADLASV